jgi:AAA family ATP:ADP antiporter
VTTAEANKEPLFRPGEFPRVALGFGAFFLLLSGYYILRPVREEMAVQTGASRIQWLFTLTFVLTLIVIPMFGWVVKRTPRRWLLPIVYGFFISNLLVFFVLFQQGITLPVAVAFFSWLSVFNLFVVSLFWSNTSDIFSTEQSHRLYGYISAGGTAGAITGPAITALIAEHVPTSTLLGISAVLLTLAAVAMMVMRRGARAQERAEERPIGGSILAGIRLAWQVVSLRGIAILIICYTTVSAVFYIEQADIAGQTFADSGERTAFFATIDLAVNALALITQIAGTRRVVQHFGLRVTLSVVPLVVGIGLLALGAWRSAFLLAIVQIVHRAGEFSLTRPGREMIYTTVDAESRYKAKNFIDTTIYRANDVVSSWLVSLARGAGLTAALVVGVPAAVAWLAAAYKIGRRHDQRQPA